MKRWIQPRILTNYLEKSFDNGHYRLRFSEIAFGLFKKSSPQCIDAVRHAWFQSQKQLRRQGMCAILVTETYFSVYHARKQPKTPDTIAACIALHGRPAAGVRLLTMKGIQNDPMALAYFKLRGLEVQGIVAAIEDRITVEWHNRKLTKRVAKRMIDHVTAPVLPYHEDEFKELME